jgi:quinol monooxygenase YgiN
MAGTVHIPWYATLFRGDRFADALAEIAPVSLRYGAHDFSVYRSRDDAYKFLHLVTFESKIDFERYWYGPEFTAFRTETAGWYQVPVLYVWNDVVIAGSLEGNGDFLSARAPAEGDTV